MNETYNTAKEMLEDAARVRDMLKDDLKILEDELQKEVNRRTEIINETKRRIVEYNIKVEACDKLVELAFREEVQHGYVEKK